MVPGLALADLTGDEAAVLSRLITSACIDIHPSIGCETIAFLKSRSDEAAADLVILTDHRADGGAAPLEVVRDFAFNGAMWGMAPGIEPLTGGSLRLTSEQTGIGRSPWRLDLTVAWRDERFLIAGVTYATWDRLSASSAVCDVNLLTGAYDVSFEAQNEMGNIVASKAMQGQSPPSPIALANWHPDHPLPQPCRDILRDFADAVP